MSNSSRLRALNQVVAYIRETNISKDQPVINAKYQRHTYTPRTDLEFRNRRRSLDRLEGRHASRAAAAQQFPVRYFRIDSQPLSSLSRTRNARHTQHSTRVRVFRSFSPFARLVQSPSFARAPSSHPILLLVLERDRDTRAREEQTRRGAERSSGQDEERGGREGPTSKWILIVLLEAPRDRRWLRRYSCYPWLKPLGAGGCLDKRRRRRQRGGRTRNRGRRKRRGTEGPGEKPTTDPFI